MKRVGRVSTILPLLLLASVLSFFSSPTSADGFVTPPAFVLQNQVSQTGPALPGNPFGVRVGLEDYFNQGGQLINVFEHGYVGVVNPDMKYQFTSYVGSIPPRAYLPPCQGPGDFPCIESVSTRSQSDTNWNPGLLSSSQPKYSFGSRCFLCTSDFDPFVPIPFNKSGGYGGVPSMWTLPGAAHGGGSDYRVDVQLNQHTQGDTPGTCGSSPCTFIQIVPLKLGSSQSFETIQTTNAPFFGLDFQQFEFPKDMEFRIVLRLAGAELLKPDGFFFGRIENLKVVTSSSAEHTLTISGTPMRVPFAQVSGLPLASIPDKLINDIDPNLRNIWSCPTLNEQACVLQFSSSSANPVLSDFSNWENLGLKTFASGTMWEVRATNPPGAGPCTNLLVNHGLTGTLSTNSTLYSSDIPTWDSVSRSFTYTVASPHLDQFGSTNRGYYQLVIPSEVVTCLWGGGASAANASVQIVSEDGTPQIATTDVHVETGMFYFTAANFEYSNPKLKVTFKVRKAAPIQINVNPPTSPSHTNSKSTITCTRGSHLKKITALHPKCPAGFKKK